MKVFYSNIADSATVFPATENLDFPATNIQNFIPSKVYKTLGTQNDESITFDLGGVNLITSIVIYNTNFDGTESNFKLQGSSDIGFSSTPVNETLTAGNVVSKTFTGGSYRYWRIIFSKTNSFDVRSMGRVYLGDYYNPTSDAGPDYSGYNMVSNDLSITNKALGGQSYIEKKSKFRTLDLTFSDKSNTAKDSLYSIFQITGTSTPIFIQVMDSAPLNEVLYMRVTNNNAYKLTAWDTDTEPVWNLAISLEEQI